MTIRTPGGPPQVCVRPPGWIGKSAAVDVSALLDWAVSAEQLGLDGIFVGDRMLGAATVGRDVVYGASMLDAFVTLSAIAARTSRLLLGPLVLVFPYRHPVQLAKATASLDVLSGGRLVLGAGIGWNAREFDALGLSLAERGSRFDEAVPLVRALWSGQPVTAAGGWWDLDGVEVSPAPVRPGGPPIWMASFSPGTALDFGSGLPPVLARALARVGRLADGWVPLTYSASASRRLSPDALGAAWELVLASAEEHGRSRDAIDFVHSDWIYLLDGPGAEQRCQAALSTFFAGSWQDALNTYLIGTADEVLARLADQTTKIDRVDAYVLTPLSGEPDQLAGIAEQIAPQLRAAGVPAGASS